MSGAPGARAGPRPELSLVIPVHNEAAVVAEVLSVWAAELERLGLDHELLVYDDGSDDETPQILEMLAARLPRLRVSRHVNVGHGPTILRGYAEARGEWVFQVDSDDETGPEHFEALWRGREGFDLLLGRRAGRRGAARRRLVSRVARAAVRVFFGPGIDDVNTPYRLVRASALAAFVPELPRDAVAPNVMMSGWAVRRGWRISERPISSRARRAGRGSLLGWTLWWTSARALAQLAAVAARSRKASRRQ